MYRAWVEEILGFNIRGETMWIAPVIPGWWDGFRITYRYGDAVYDISVENPEHCERGISFVDIDGVRIEDGVIHLVREAGKHEVLVRMGALS
jgi:cellobiose phosphorylase